MDGTITVFEQESFAFTRFLPGALLPGPIRYSARSDSFITVSSSRQVESYKWVTMTTNAELSLPSCHCRAVIAELSLLNCRCRIVIVELSLPNCRYRIVVAELSLPNCHCQVVIAKVLLICRRQIIPELSLPNCYCQIAIAIVSFPYYFVLVPLRQVIAVQQQMKMKCVKNIELHHRRIPFVFF